MGLTFFRALRGKLGIDAFSCKGMRDRYLGDYIHQYTSGLNSRVAIYKLYQCRIFAAKSTELDYTMIFNSTDKY